MNFPWVKPAMLGIDIQPEAIRLAQLQQKRNKYYSQRLETIALPEKIIEEGKIKHWDRLTETLYRAIEVMELKNLPAALAVPVSLVRINKLSLPRQLSDEALESEINSHIHRELPGMSAGLCFDYDRIAASRSTQEIHCVVIREDYLSRLVAAVTSAGINVKVVDVDVYALQRFNNHKSELMPPLHDLNFMLACGLAMREAPPW